MSGKHVWMDWVTPKNPFLKNWTWSIKLVTFHKVWWSMPSNASSTSSSHCLAGLHCMFIFSNTFYSMIALFLSILAKNSLWNWHNSSLWSFRFEIDRSHSWVCPPPIIFVILWIFLLNNDQNDKNTLDSINNGLKWFDKIQAYFCDFSLT